MSGEWHRPAGDGTGWDEAAEAGGLHSEHASSVAEEAGIGPGDDALCCGTCECSTLSLKPTTTPPQPTERRFGERLRPLVRHHSAQLTQIDPWVLRDIADAIDQDHRDALTLTGEGVAELWKLQRRKVEQLVEELRYVTQTGPIGFKDVLEAEPFLERLGEIFGDRQEALKKIKMAEDAKWFEVPGRDGAKGLRVAVNPDGSVGLWPVDPAVGAGFALHAEAARDLETILRAMLLGEFTGAPAVLGVSARDPRERHGEGNGCNPGRNRCQHPKI